MGTRSFAALVLVLLAGCGEAERSGSREPAPASTRAAEPAPSGQRAKVKIVGFEYAPKTLKVTAGTKITWVNQDASNHTVTFTKAPGDLGNVDPKRRLTAKLTKPGRYAYVCEYHPSMTGTVTVQ